MGVAMLDSGAGPWGAAPDRCIHRRVDEPLGRREVSRQGETTWRARQWSNRWRGYWTAAMET